MPVSKPMPDFADPPVMSAPFPFPRSDPADPGWHDPTWFDRVGVWLRGTLKARLGLDPWSAGLALWAGICLASGLFAWLAALAQGAARLPALAGWLAFSVLAVRFLVLLEARLRPRPLPRTGPRGSSSGDAAFWRALRRAGVNVRIARALHAGGIQGAEDVRRWSDAALLAIPGVGPRTVERLRRVVADQEEAAP